MHLPNVDQARVTESKISEYLLALGHPTGRDKARFFRALGFDSDRPFELRGALLNHAASHTVSSVQQTRFGVKYVVDGRIVGPTGRTAQIRSVWVVAQGEGFPRLVTAYPLRGAER